VVGDPPTGGAVDILTGWVLKSETGTWSGGLRDLSKRQRGHAYADTCFRGKAVAGLRRLSELKQEFGGQFNQIPSTGTQYRFGRGAAGTVASYRVSMQVGQMRRSFVIDFIRGDLPFIIGTEVLGMYQLWINMGDSSVYQTCPQGHLRIVNQGTPGELPMVPVRPGHSKGAVRIGAEVLFMGRGSSEVVEDPGSGDSIPAGTVLRTLVEEEKDEEEKEEKKWQEEVKAVLGEDGEEPEDELKKILKLTTEELTKIHKQGHPGVDRMMDFLVVMVSSLLSFEFCPSFF